jgi:hypothetical protein
MVAMEPVTSAAASKTSMLGNCAEPSVAAMSGSRQRVFHTPCVLLRYDPTPSAAMHEREGHTADEEYPRRSGRMQQEQAQRPPAPTRKHREPRSAPGAVGTADRTRSGAEQRARTRPSASWPQRRHVRRARVWQAGSASGDAGYAANRQRYGMQRGGERAARTGAPGSANEQRTNRASGCPA